MMGMAQDFTACKLHVYLKYYVRRAFLKSRNSREEVVEWIWLKFDT